MTTASTTTALNNLTDADFRVWGSAFSALLASCGLTQAGDTGQINWATVTRPAANTVAGYEIWYLNDSLHATKPIYIRFEYASGSPANTRININAGVASGTNGAGTLSGTTYMTSQSIGVNANFTASTYPSFACATAGFFGISAFRRLSGGSHSVTLLVCRTTDAAGVPTTTGVNCYTNSTWLAGQWVRHVYVGGTLYAGDQTFCTIPGAPVTTVISSNVRVFRHFSMQPDVICQPQLVSFYGGASSEIPTETTFTATPVGVTARTYLALADAGGPTSGAQGGASSTNNRIGMLWE